MSSMLVDFDRFKNDPYITFFSPVNDENLTKLFDYYVNSLTFSHENKIYSCYNLIVGLDQDIVGKVKSHLDSLKPSKSVLCEISKSDSIIIVRMAHIDEDEQNKRHNHSLVAPMTLNQVLEFVKAQWCGSYLEGFEEITTEYAYRTIEGIKQQYEKLKVGVPQHIVYMNYNDSNEIKVFSLKLFKE